MDKMLRDWGRVIRSLPAGWTLAESHIDHQRVTGYYVRVKGDLRVNDHYTWDGSRWITSAEALNRQAAAKA